MEPTPRGTLSFFGPGQPSARLRLRPVARKCQAPLPGRIEVKVERWLLLFPARASSSAKASLNLFDGLIAPWYLDLGDFRHSYNKLKTLTSLSCCFWASDTQSLHPEMFDQKRATCQLDLNDDIFQRLSSFLTFSDQPRV